MDRHSEYRNNSFRKTAFAFYLRWALNSFALWFLITAFGEVGGGARISTFIIAGLIFSIANSVLKPILTILSISAILLTLGLFTFILNGFILWFSVKISPNISITFGNAILASIVMSFINYTVTRFFENYSYKKEVL